MNRNGTGGRGHLPLIPFTRNAQRHPAGANAANSTHKTQLRQSMRRRRRQLDHEEIRSASECIANKVWSLPALKRAKNIAIYMSIAGEIDCSFIATGAWLRKKRVFLPVLAQKRLFFAPLRSDSKFAKNRYQIAEPIHHRDQRVNPDRLDVVIVPLLAFDLSGNRVGMGAGFYDRSFAIRLRREKWRRPLLVGVAYSFQRVESLAANNWDVPLDAVITEKECFGSY